MGKNEKTKKPKPKYNVWQNTAYMLSVAWDTRRSVPLLVVLLAVCTAGKTTAEMLISPAVLGKLESGAPLGQLLGAIGGFTILLFALTALCYYIDHLTMFGRCGVRLELLKRINTKRTRTAYANLLDEAFRLMYQKGHDACMNNRASGEAFWKSWTDILTNLIGFGVYLALLSGLNPWLCVLTALTAVVSYFSTRNINEWGYRHREEGAKITRSLHYLRNTAEGREFGKDIRIFGLRQWLTDLYDSALRLNYAFLEKRERAYLTANLIDLALLLVRNGAAYAYLLWLTVTRGLPVSCRLAGIAVVVALCVGIPLGCISAYNRGKWLDNVIIVFATCGIAIPSFISSVLLLYQFGMNMKVLPTVGLNSAAAYIMPVTALAIYPSAYITRLMRSSLLDVMGQDYMRTARAKGVSQFMILFKHALRNAILPVITYVGPMLASLMTGSFVVEKIFSVPGLGRDFVSAITNRDYTMIMGTTILLSSMVIIANVIVDILYKIIDPRIKLQ